MYIPLGSNIISGSGMSSSSNLITTAIETTITPATTSHWAIPADNAYNESLQNSITVFCMVMIIIVICMCCCFFCAK